MEEKADIEDNQDNSSGQLLDNSDGGGDGDESVIVEAETVYILMPKNVPVTRASRLQWLLEHINCVITWTPAPLKDNDDLEIVSIVPCNGEIAINNKYQVTTSTNVVFLSRSYRFVYCLDMSPSQSAVDLERGEILFDQILHRFKTSLDGVCREFTIPGNTIVFQPCLFLTVIVNTPFFISPAQQVLVKGVQVSSHNIDEIVSLVTQHFHLLEGRIAQVAAMAYDQIELQLMENEGMVGALFDLSDNECIANIPMVSPDANFVNMLRYSILAISLLPENSLSHILVITDGVVAMPDSNIMESILFQLHFDSISVSFIKVGAPFHPHTSAGYVSYTDLLYFLSHSTLGTYLENLPIIAPKSNGGVCNIFHKLYLFWTYHTNSKYSSSLMTSEEQTFVIRNTSFYSNRIPTLLSKRQAEENITASLPLLLCRRIREGYTLTGVDYSNDILKVKLCLHWKAFIFVHYILTLPWPGSNTKNNSNLTHFEVHISAPYDFLHDITCLMKKETKSSYRQAVFERFWIRLTQLTSSDTILAQSLSSFNLNNLWFTLPESVKSGIPAFTLNNSTSHDGTKLVLSPRDNSCGKFLSLWQPICQLETSNWRKWFHTHKLSLILRHDHPLPKHIHMANSSGRFQVIQCRQAATALYSLLSDWASFILIDNHTYVKLLHKNDHQEEDGSNKEKPPLWFCIVRVTSKFPCATLNLGFVTGTPGIVRYKVLEDLKSVVLALSYQPTKKSLKEFNLRSFCCTLLQKPLEKILIRYERMPSDFHTVIFPDGTQPPHAMQSLPSSPLAGTLFTTLSRYLFHQRWIWSATHTSDTRLGVTAMTRILSTITKMRLEEGFNFAHSSAGIVTMAIELPMDSNSSCTVQYVLFPPHSSWWGEGDAHSGSDDDAEIEPEIDCELQMVTEVWIEPQNGRVSTSSPRLKYVNNKAYYEIAEEVRTLDLKCITSLLTLEHLSLKCQDKKTRPLDAQIPTYRSININNHNHRMMSHGNNLGCRFNFDNMGTNMDTKAIWNPLFVHRIQHIPFQFDLINILPLCHQTEILFSMFIEEGEEEDSKSNLVLLENIHNHLQYLHDYKLELTKEESIKYTKQIMERNKTERTENGGEHGEALWSCYVKGVSVTHVILTFIPTSLHDLKQCFKHQHNGEARILPLYVYDCPLASLVDSYINMESVKTKNDSYEDRRFNINMESIEDSIKLNDVCVPNANANAKQHCKALCLAHSKCFTMSLFTALHYGSFVHHSDVQSAMEQCEETTYEIDITSYLKTICQHFKTTSPTSSCSELKPLHKLIKDKFFDITNVSFQPIPSYPEYYFCKNLMTLNLEKNSSSKNDSDDEISNAPSDLLLNNKSEHDEKDVVLLLDLDLNQAIKCDGNMTPLFLHFICTIRHNGIVTNSSLKCFPTCFEELIDDLGSIQNENIEITLDILCLTLPNDVQNVITDYSNKGLRTTSFCSDVGGGGSSLSESSINSDMYNNQEPLLYIPEIQRRAINTLREEIKWLLKDEIATCLLDVEPVSSTSLNFVIKHVSESMSRSSCLLDIIDLNFVYGSTHSYEKFVHEFSKISLPNYKLVKEEELYYLVKKEEDANLCLLNTSLDSSGLTSQDDVFSDVSSMLGGEEFDWLIDLNNKRPNLPNFWLIMQIDQDAVTIYFHCRFLELHTTHVGVYLNVQRAICDAIKDICKKVNQSLLLQSLHDTRNCDHLLESDDQNGSFGEWENNIPSRSTSFTRLKSMEEIGDESLSENYSPALLEASRKFKAGYFSCPIVWQTHFVLHPRLKTGPGKSGISIGIMALKSVLDKFSVANRKNMFVYQDKDSNVFYLRLHENLHNLYNKSGQFKSNEFENQLVFRSPSIASLPIGQRNNLNKLDQSISSSNNELRPRVQSFGEKETKEGPNDDTIILRVHGITEAGKDVRCELVQVLQNRLDDAVLEFLSVMLARNTMCPLTPEDVQFLQKPFRPPEVIIRLSIQEYTLNYLVPFSYYLKQNLLQFLNIPKYTDSRPHYHFKDYTENEPSYVKNLDENIFIYNQSQSSAGNRGIACIALTITDNNNTTTNNDNNKSTSTFEEDMLKLFENTKETNFDEIVSCQLLHENENEGLPNTYLEFRLWKQGRVNIDNLCQKLRAATSQAMWDLIMEYHLLKQPLCCPKHQSTNINKPNKQTSTINSNKTHLKTPQKIEQQTKETQYKVVLDLTLTKRKKTEEEKTKTNEVIINLDNTTNNIINNINKKSNKAKKNMIKSFENTKINLNLNSNNNNNVDVLNVLNLNEHELGGVGVLSGIYTNILREWFEFGDKINAPAIRKIKINLTNQHALNLTLKELQGLIVTTSHDAVKVFASEINDEFIPFNLNNVNQSYATKCVLIARNFEQWKASTAFKGLLDFPELLSQHSLKNIQKFIPALIGNHGKVFVPRQKILWGVVTSEAILLYTYNWSKDNVDKLLEHGNNVGMWLSIRGSLLHSITAQKLGLFCNQAITRKSMFAATTINNPYINIIGENIENIIKFPKGRKFAQQHTFPTLLLTTLEAFKDMYVHKSSEQFYSNSNNFNDPVVAFTLEMNNLKKVDKRHRDELKKLHSMYQSRTNTSTLSQIQILMQNSRTIHYCHTPFLFLPRWRIQSAATRDHSIINPLRNYPKKDNEETWHEILCLNFINEYKRYLQTLGFMSLEVKSSNCIYMQKAILGGILIFTIQLVEPFFITKLHAIECNRLQNTNSTTRTSINQFTLSFIDECDKIKIFIHLHSFTYDFHLRCVYNYVANNNNAKFCENYQLIHFLDDFMKYYNKAPNYARNLLYSDTITINNLLTEGKVLYNYLLDNIKHYNFKKLKMKIDDVAAFPSSSSSSSTISSSSSCSEYVLVQISATPKVSYKDSQDRKHTDDFDVTLIICNSSFESSQNQANSLHLKYYLILTTNGEKYPKSEVERKMGKFRTVSFIGLRPNNSVCCVEKQRLISENSELNVDVVNDEDMEVSLNGDGDCDETETENENEIQIENDNEEVSRHLKSQPYEIKQEPVNYLGYYSSHEQIMQQLILDWAGSSRKQILDMVSKGTVHCRTHLLWEKLLNSPQMTYNEFVELKSLSKLKNLCDLNTSLHPLLNHQPVSWYQGLAKLLLVKYNDQHRSFCSTDGNIQHTVILHPNYTGAFMMLSMDLHTSRGDLYVVYRTSHYDEVFNSHAEREVLINGFIHCVCYYLWSGMI